MTEKRRLDYDKENLYGQSASAKRSKPNKSYGIDDTTSDDSVDSEDSSFGPESCFRELVYFLKKAASSSDECYVQGEAFELPKIIGIEVTNFGPISFPLVEAQSSSFIKFCHTNFVCGYAIHDPYQINASNVKIANPDWDEKLKLLVERVAKSLGIKGHLQAKLEKFVIYEKLKHFREGRKKDQNEEIVGKLFIQPPSIHTGGQLAIWKTTENNIDAKKIIDFGQKEGNSRYSIYFAAHYADLNTEQFDTTYGYRPVLEYSLILPKSDGKASFITGDNVDKALPIVAALNSDFYIIGIILENKYGKKKIHVDTLEGVDLERFKLLNKINSLLSADKQLAIYTCKVNLSLDLHDDYVVQRKVETSNWCNSSGKGVFKDANIELKEFTKVYDLSGPRVKTFDQNNYEQWSEFVESIKTDVDSDDDDIKTAVKRTYEKNLLVFWPKCFEPDILLKSNFLLFLKRIHDSVVANNEPVNETIAADIRRMVDYVTTFDQMKIIKYFQHIVNIEEVLAVLQKFDDLKYVEKFVTKLKHRVVVSSRLAEFIAHFKSQELNQLLVPLLRPSPENINQMCELIIKLHERECPEITKYYFENCILTILNEKTQLDRVLEKLGEMNLTSSYLGIPLSNLSQNRQTNNNLETFKTFFKCVSLFPERTKIDSMLAQIIKIMNERENTFTGLINGLLRDEKIIIQIPRLLNIIEGRKTWLEEQTKQEPLFTWSMPNAKINDYPKIEEFLKSPLPEMSFPFPSRTMLNRFVSMYNDTYGWTAKKGYSAKITARTGNMAFIQKTRKLYEQQVIMYNSHIQELNNIQTYLSSR